MIFLRKIEVFYVNLRHSCVELHFSLKITIPCNSADIFTFARPRVAGWLVPEVQQGLYMAQQGLWIA